MKMTSSKMVTKSASDAVVFPKGEHEYRFGRVVVRVNAPTDLRLSDIYLEGVILDAAKRGVRDCA